MEAKSEFKRMIDAPEYRVKLLEATANETFCNVKVIISKIKMRNTNTLFSFNFQLYTICVGLWYTIQQNVHF